MYVGAGISIHTVLADCDMRIATHQWLNSTISIHTVLADCDYATPTPLNTKKAISIHTVLADCDAPFTLEIQGYCEFQSTQSSQTVTPVL